jgi:signal transduction histidine kinase
MEDDENHSVYGPPVTFDVDGDGTAEIILGGYDHHLYCFEFDGTPVCGWPVVVEDFIIQSLALAELDGQGTEELVVGQFGESVFAYHLDPFGGEDTPAAGSSPSHTGWHAEYYLITLIVVFMLLLLVHLIRLELTGERDSVSSRARGIAVLLLAVLGVRVVFFAGDMFRYSLTMSRLEKAGTMAEAVLRNARDEAQALADSLVGDLNTCRPEMIKDPLRSLRCLERLADRHRLEYRFNGLLLTDGAGRVIRGVGLGRGWQYLDELGLDSDAASEPVLLGDTPMFAVEAAENIIAGDDTLRFFMLSSLLNRVPNDIADATGFSSQVRVGGRTIAWGGAGPRPYRSLRPWLGIVQPAREIEIISRPGEPGISILIAEEDFERPASQWLDLAAVIVLPVAYLVLARRRGNRKRIGLKKWWMIVFGAAYIAGALLIHRGRVEIGPVPLSGRALEVVFHMVGMTGITAALHRIVTSRRSRRLNFALLGSYLIVSLIPLSVILIVGGNLFLNVQRGIIEKTINSLGERADNMVLAFMGNSSFVNTLRDEGPALFDLSTETSWLDFVQQHRYLFNYDLPSSYITLWARDREAPERYFTGYSYVAPRTGKLYYTRPGWTGDDNISGLFLDNGTALIRAMRHFRHDEFEMDLVGHIPLDEKIIGTMEDRLRLLPFLPRIHLEPAWLESRVERSRPDGWYVPFSSELILPARDWGSGNPRWVVYRASMYIPTGGEMAQVLIPVILLILIPLSLSFWGAYTTFRSTARPLTRLLTGIRRVGAGDLEYRLGEAGQGEIGLAARSFDSMALSLQEKIGELAEKHRLEEVNELKSQFISMVSHDLKTPLASIKGAAENVLEEVTGPVNEKQRRYLQMILDSSSDLQKMITNLLDLSAIESGRLQLNIEPMDINRKAKDILRQFGPVLEKNGLEGRMSVRTESTIVLGDQVRVWQILNNIVTNAVRYSPEGGIVEIIIEDIPVDETHGKRMVRVSVRDQGPGISEKGAAKLFEPFFYRAPDTSSGSHGAGLGLAIVKQLVELHGGEVSIRNSRSGGAVFSFTLPV